MNLEIVDFNIQQQPIIAKRIYIKLIELNFNISATFEVYFYTSSNEYDMTLAKVEKVEIKDQEYKDWNNNDDYAIQLVLTKLGLTKK